jgi:hypothetical protein
MMTSGEMKKSITIRNVDGSPSGVCSISGPCCSGGGASTLRGELRLDLVHQSPQRFHFGWVVCDDAAQKVG